MREWEEVGVQWGTGGQGGARRRKKQRARGGVRISKRDPSAARCISEAVLSCPRCALWEGR